MKRFAKKPKYFKNQRYAVIRKECLKKGELFEDPEFPPNNKSLFFSKIDNEIQWKRPGELCKVPKLVVEGVTTDDLQEGEIGNTWFVTACASLTKHKGIFHTVVPDVEDQEWKDEGSGKSTYAGVFKFQFWRYGEWLEIVVDDKLPTKDDRLIFCHSTSRNEFWSALLEKAYAKLYGDYETLSNGRTADALVDFTGGVAEKLVVSKIGLNDFNSQLDFFTKMNEALQNDALINCNIECSVKDVGNVTPQGLILGHGYNVTRLMQITVPRKLQSKLGLDQLFMIRLANPWGTKEWSGPWCDGAEEWEALSKHDWDKLGIVFRTEGEFWMSLDDFISHFTNVDICHFVNTKVLSLKKTWQENIFHGRWQKSGGSGGIDFDSVNFLNNPQYLFDIPRQKDNIMVSLEQHDISASRTELGILIDTIGFHVMKVEENRRYRVHVAGDVVLKSDYTKSRSVVGTAQLPKGRYVIIPAIEEVEKFRRFMLRLYTSDNASARELIAHQPLETCLGRRPLQVTSITVKGATGLKLPLESKDKEVNAYLKIICEGESVVSDPQTNTSSPEWNIRATFYRSKPNTEPIVVQIWNKQFLIDDFMAEATILKAGPMDGENRKCDLYGRRTEKTKKVPGTLQIFIKSSNDLNSL